MALSIRLFIMFALLLATLSPSMTAIPLNAQSNEPVPIWTVTGNGVGKMGEIAINAGDLNQDGYADIAVGGSGKIVLYAGSADGLAGEPELVVTEFNEAPSYVDNLLAGDFDGDGEIDLVLAAPFADESMGALYLYYGAEGETGVPWTLFGAVADSTLGKGLDRGDFNGDGIADLVVSAPSTYNDEVAGEVYLYYGSTSELGDPATPDLVLRGADPALRYGDVVRNVGDLNGDGYDDLVIQAEDDDLRIDLHFGSPDGLAAEPLTSLYAQQYDFIFADSVAALGDVNGDGYADFAVAAANIDDLLIAYLIYGAAEWEEMSSESIQLPDTGRLDAIVNQVGDVDGDGYDDLAFSLVVPTYRDEGTSAVYLFRGGAGGIELDPAYVISTDVIADGFGYAVAPADVNGDGVPELLIGAPGDTTAGDFAGKAYLYSFTAKAPVGMTDGLRWQPSRIQEIVSPDADDLAGIQPTAIGDINGDGYDDLAALGLRGTGDGAVSYVAILLGSAEGLPDKPDLAAPATNWRAALGDVAGELSFWTVAGVGDLNGDGLDDFGLTVLTDAGDVVLLFAGGEEEPEEEPIGLLTPGYDPENAEAYPITLLNSFMVSAI
ncbi:MAG: VCBS repeat-containing protein [Caldilineaceae bacterium]